MNKKQFFIAAVAALLSVSSVSATDITGVTDLKIEMYGNGTNYFVSRLSSVLVDVVLQRKK